MTTEVIAATAEAGFRELMAMSARHQQTNLLVAEARKKNVADLLGGLKAYIELCLRHGFIDEEMAPLGQQFITAISAALGEESGDGQ